METIKLHGGDMGNSAMLVRCDLSQASAPVMIRHDPDEDGCGWMPTQYQCADALHSLGGLTIIGKQIAAQACEVPATGFSCQWEAVDLADDRSA